MSNLIKPIVIICIILFALTIWPTLYRYEHSKVGTQNVSMRTNRFTGKTQIFYQKGEETDNKEKPLATTSAFNAYEYKFSSKELAKVKGTADIYYKGEIPFFGGEVYNDTDRYITTLEITLTATESNGTVRWSKKFRTNVSLSPHSFSLFSIRIFDHEGAKLSWSIDNIYT